MTEQRLLCVQRHVRQTVCSSTHVPGQAHPDTDAELGWATPMLREWHLPPWLPHPFLQPCRLTLLLSRWPCLSQMAAVRHHAPLCSELKAAYQAVHDFASPRALLTIVAAPLPGPVCRDCLLRGAVQEQRAMYWYQQQNDSRPMTPITRKDSLSETACKVGQWSLPDLLIGKKRHAPARADILAGSCCTGTAIALTGA